LLGSKSKVRKTALNIDGVVHKSDMQRVKDLLVMS
jgi:ribosomal protein L35